MIIGAFRLQGIVPNTIVIRLDAPMPFPIAVHLNGHLKRGGDGGIWTFANQRFGAVSLSVEFDGILITHGAETQEIPIGFGEIGSVRSQPNLGVVVG